MRAHHAAVAAAREKLMAEKKTDAFDVWFLHPAIAVLGVRR